MDFSSTPAYNLDASNWQQQQNHRIIGSSSTNTFLPPPLPQPHGGSTGIGSIRPGCMSEHPRLANIIHLPETSIKCPRCESTNTKFCYYNNYNLLQPRHFCKTCRRYWTIGGALRSIPVGGGCRRNKRTSKSATSKSPASTDRQTTGGSASILGLRPPQFASFPLMLSPAFSQLTDHSFTSEMNYSGISAQLVRTSDQIMNFNSLRDVVTPQRLQQFPFLDGNLDPLPVGNYQFHGIGELGFEKLEDSEKADLSMQGNDEWNHILPSNSNTDWTNFNPSSSSSNFDTWIIKSLNL